MYLAPNGPIPIGSFSKQIERCEKRIALELQGFRHAQQMPFLVRSSKTRSSGGAFLIFQRGMLVRMRKLYPKPLQRLPYKVVQIVKGMHLLRNILYHRVQKSLLVQNGLKS